MDAVSSDVGAVDDAGSLLDLIGLLYDAAAAPERWRNFLEAGARYFGAFGASFIRYDPARQERSVAFLTGYPDAPREIQVEAMHKLIAVQADDPRVRYSLAHPGQPFHCRQIVTEAELHASRNYVEILQPNGVEYSLMVTLTEPPEAFAGLGFHRGPTGQVFNDENVAALGLLVPHLSRTLAIQDRLGALDQRTQASYQVLDALPTGIIILRVGGNVEYANAAAQALLASRDGIAIAGGGGASVWPGRAMSRLFSPRCMRLHEPACTGASVSKGLPDVLRFAACSVSCRWSMRMNCRINWRSSASRFISPTRTEHWKHRRSCCNICSA